jgi:hypothetical protein
VKKFIFNCFLVNNKKIRTKRSAAAQKKTKPHTVQRGFFEVQYKETSALKQIIYYNAKLD